MNIISASFTTINPTISVPSPIARENRLEREDERDFYVSRFLVLKHNPRGSRRDKRYTYRRSLHELCHKHYIEMRHGGSSMFVTFVFHTPFSFSPCKVNIKTAGRTSIGESDRIFKANFIQRKNRDEEGM